MTQMMSPTQTFDSESVPSSFVDISSRGAERDPQVTAIDPNFELFGDGSGFV